MEDLISTTDESRASAPASPEGLRHRIAKLRLRPFAHQVVQSPWHNIDDFGPLHAKLKDRIKALIDTCDDPEASRCLTIHAPPGYGKTHLLAWTRQLLDDRPGSVFVYVPPFRPGGNSFENHLLRSVIDALKLRSLVQARDFDASVRSRLVGDYDRLVETPEGRRTIKPRSWMARTFLSTAWLKIAGENPKNQDGRLREAFRHRFFFEKAFRRFTEECAADPHRQFPAGTHADWDTFIAASLLVSGDDSMQWLAGQWFQEPGTPSDLLRRYHVLGPCRGTSKAINAIVTLNRLAGQVFCLAFDQLEDTYLGFQEHHHHPGDAFSRTIGPFVGGLYNVPQFGLLFLVQTSVWSAMPKNINAYLIGRMIEPDGPHQIVPLGPVETRQFVRGRMDATVWEALGQEPPKDWPLFPFTDDQVQTIRRESNGEVRGLLRGLDRSYSEWLGSTPEPPNPPPINSPIKFRSVDPPRIPAGKPSPLAIHAEDLPRDVIVYFGDAVAERVVCRAGRGLVEVTAPPGLNGLVEIRVVDAEDPSNQATGSVMFSSIHSPYYECIDRKRFRDQRKELGLTQVQVASRLNVSSNKISQFETGSWTKPNDQFIEDLARLFNSEVDDFLPLDRDGPGPGSNA